MSVPSPRRPPPVRLLGPDAPTVFAPGRETAWARVAGDGLRALDVRDGDHVVLVRRDRAEHGDLAAVLDAEGRACLWKVYPESDALGVERLRLSMGTPALTFWSPPSPRIHGVVVAVLRGGRPDRPITRSADPA